MQKIEILVVGKHPKIMSVILRLINNNDEWNGTGVFSVDEAMDKRGTTPFKLVLLGAGLNEDETMQIQVGFTVPVVQHYGGGSGLLYGQIYQALNV